MALNRIAGSILAIAATITPLGRSSCSRASTALRIQCGFSRHSQRAEAWSGEGYLPPSSLPNSLELLPAPPQPRLHRYALDVETAEATFPRGTPRWELSARDANLNFPAAASIYSCALGVPISKEETPRLYTLLHRVLSDAGLATYSAKNHYQRPRPFTVNNQPMCTPEDDELSETTGRILRATPPLAGPGRWS